MSRTTALFFQQVQLHRFAEQECSRIGLDPAVILAAYDETRTIFEQLLDGNSAAESASHSLSFLSTWNIKSWLRPQEKKAQIQIPLKNLRPANFSGENEQSGLYAELPINLQKVAHAFERTALEYLALNLNNSDAGAIDDNETLVEMKKSFLLKKSVLRLWSYDIDPDDVDSNSSSETKEGKQPGEESARTHADPGFCTILASGSSPEHLLQVHSSFDGPSEGVEKDGVTHYTGDKDGEADPAGWLTIGLPTSETALASSASFDPTRVALLNGTMLQVALGGKVKHAYHRVVVVAKKTSSSQKKNRRIQIVFELRPDDLKKWYTRGAAAAAAAAATVAKDDDKFEEDSY